MDVLDFLKWFGIAIAIALVGGFFIGGPLAELFFYLYGKNERAKTPGTPEYRARMEKEARKAAIQQNPKLNPHGIAGLLFIALLFGIAFYLNWNVNWWYLVPTVVLYSSAVIFLTRAEEKIPDTEWFVSRYLLGCHLALLFLAGGLLLHFKDGGITLGYFIASVFGGLIIPFLLSISKHYLISPHGLIAMLLVALMFGIAFFYSWNINWTYFIATIVLCSISGTILNFYLAVEPPLSPLRRRRVLLGWYIICIFLVGGFGLHFKDGGIALVYFIASIAAGLFIPRLLYRGAKAVRAP